MDVTFSTLAISILLVIIAVVLLAAIAAAIAASVYLFLPDIDQMIQAVLSS
jgi:hypothetical protein